MSQCSLNILTVLYLTEVWFIVNEGFDVGLDKFDDGDFD